MNVVAFDKVARPVHRLLASAAPAPATRNAGLPAEPGHDNAHDKPYRLWPGTAPAPGPRYLAAQPSGQDPRLLPADWKQLRSQPACHRQGLRPPEYQNLHTATDKQKQTLRGTTSAALHPAQNRGRSPRTPGHSAEYW